MKGGDLTAFSGTMPANGNGVHRAAKKNGATSKRAAAVVDSATAVPLEPFAAVDADSVDAPMWPVHSTVWYQPDLAPSVPAWSGLAIEHRRRIPSPDFISLETGPFQRADAMDRASDVVRAEPRPEPPPSGLEPLGWDPRTIGGKEPGK